MAFISPALRFAIKTAWVTITITSTISSLKLSEGAVAVVPFRSILQVAFCSSLHSSMTISIWGRYP